MKKTRIVLVGALVLALALVMGCKMGAGEDGKVTGTKWDSTLTVDATEESTTPLTKKYRRFWEQLGYGEKVTKIESTITIDLEKSVTEGTSKDDNKTQTYASVGLIFNLHEYKATADSADPTYGYKEGDDLVEFVLFGYQPKTGRAFLDHYYDVPKKGLKNEDGSTTLDTDLSAIAPQTQTDTWDPEKEDMVNNVNMFSWQKNATTNYVVVSKEGEKETKHKIQVRVEKGSTNNTYSVKLYNTKTSAWDEVAVYNTTHDKHASIADGGSPKGGVGVYSNVPFGCKMVAEFIQNRDNTVGLYVEE